MKKTVRKTSILQSERKCAVCGCIKGLEAHEVFFGTSNRTHSLKEGLWVWLCAEHHRGDTGVHKCIALNCELKQIAQAKWQQVNGKGSDDFIAKFGKSWL